MENITDAMPLQAGLGRRQELARGEAVRERRATARGHAVPTHPVCTPGLCFGMTMIL